MENSTNIVPEGFDFKIVNLIDLNKKYITESVSMATKCVTEGFYDSIKALVYAKKGMELFSALEKAIRPIAESEQKLSKGEIHVMHNASITQKETGVKYDFSTCNDSEYNDLKMKHDALSEKLKEREDFLKKITKTLTIIDEDSGEVLAINPPIKSGKTGLAISIK